MTSRGAITGLGLCVDELLHSLHASVTLSVLPHLVNVAANPYWLVKVSLGCMCVFGCVCGCVCVWVCLGVWKEMCFYFIIFVHELQPSLSSHT